MGRSTKNFVEVSGTGREESYSRAVGGVSRVPAVIVSWTEKRSMTGVPCAPSARKNEGGRDYRGEGSLPTAL